jgi:hypothetical protein
LEHDIGGGEGADVVSRADEGHPGRRDILTRRRDQREVMIGEGIDVLDRIRPLEK